MNSAKKMKKLKKKRFIKTPAEKPILQMEINNERRCG
jgi:hypothetical protein